MVNASVGEYNASTNISTTFERSGSVTLPEKLGLLENVLSDNLGFSIGNKTSLADITLYTFIYEFFDDKNSAFNACLNNTKTLAIIERVNNLQQAIEWRENRPETKF